MNLVAEYDVSLKEVVIQFGAFEVSATVIRPLFVKSFIIWTTLIKRLSHFQAFTQPVIDLDHFIREMI